MTTVRSRIWVGHKAGRKDEVFRSVRTPTQASHGDRYAAVTGPFRTVRGAEFMAKYGRNNPHCQTVTEAEALAKSRR